MSRRTVIVGGLGLGVMLVSGSAFVHKMVDFVLTMSGPEVRGFGAVAVSTYLVGMVPIVCVMLWAIFTGRFADIEGPKFRMLELNREIDLLDAEQARQGGRHG